jgi:hypothetical protein
MQEREMIDNTDTASHRDAETPRRRDAELEAVSHVGVQSSQFCLKRDLGIY